MRGLRGRDSDPSVPTAMHRLWLIGLACGQTVTNPSYNTFFIDGNVLRVIHRGDASEHPTAAAERVLCQLVPLMREHGSSVDHYVLMFRDSAGLWNRVITSNEVLVQLTRP